ncbi:MAG: acetylglutamate kinase [Anaerolineae bacterium]|nr:acetylglutamate kinase [Anaerolineae bacterium]NUQ02321.1 acetylglutamate kinase [Anaerolineae bacterium]
MTLVIKISGHELDSQEYLNEFAGVVAKLADPVVIVHGGGKEISQLQERMGITPRYVDGVRVTDADSLALVEMVLCGTVNKRLVRTLVNAGVDAVGLSGVDFALVRAEKMGHAAVDMGFTGEVSAVRPEPLQAFLGDGLTPVIAPICIGVENNFNVNADHVAGALAVALEAERLVFLSNVPGVLVNGQVVPSLTDEQSEVLIADETIFGGMIPKVRTATATLRRGVRAAVITHLDGLRNGGGTVITATHHR